MMNQYDEVLNFILADVGVPNRGVGEQHPDGTAKERDQTVCALSYSKIVTQRTYEGFYLISVEGRDSTLGKTDISKIFNGQKIHHEPGLWLFMTNKNISFQPDQTPEKDRVELSIARMGSVPHGNSFIAVGFPTTLDWEQLPDEKKRPPIPGINGVVVGGGSNPDERALDPIRDPADNIRNGDYFAPYRYSHESPFKGDGGINGFTGFEPVKPTLLLRHALENYLKGVGSIKKVITLEVDSTIDHSGYNRVVNPSVGNTPFYNSPSRHDGDKLHIYDV